MQELVRGDYLGRTHIGLDFFDASINRVAAWAIGARSTLRALLAALLEPLAEMRRLEDQGDYTGRLALLEALKALPLGAAWDYYCMGQGAPVGPAFMQQVEAYEREVLARRV
jgi:L-rhamnose isomerase